MDICFSMKSLFNSIYSYLTKRCSNFFNLSEKYGLLQQFVAYQKIHVFKTVTKRRLFVHTANSFLIAIISCMHNNSRSFGDVYCPNYLSRAPSTNSVLIQDLLWHYTRRGFAMFICSWVCLQVLIEKYGWDLVNALHSKPLKIY